MVPIPMHHIRRVTARGMARRDRRNPCGSAPEAASTEEEEERGDTARSTMARRTKRHNAALSSFEPICRSVLALPLLQWTYWAGLPLREWFWNRVLWRSIGIPQVLYLSDPNFQHVLWIIVNAFFTHHSSFPLDISANAEVSDPSRIKVCNTFNRGASLPFQRSFSKSFPIDASRTNNNGRDQSHLFWWKQHRSSHATESVSLL